MGLVRGVCRLLVRRVWVCRFLGEGRGSCLRFLVLGIKEKGDRFMIFQVKRLA